MHLAALELHGFKSFAKSTRLVFDVGITCVVGPNGSGKSGIADGIRWVLGEQSLKSIRAKRSEDVIFQGSRAKARLGLAEVSLTLADAETQGLDTPELAITRRIDRNGLSEYLVNGRPVRLLDLAELLADAGFAQKSYTVIPQGMIDAFVTASAQERRQMFEDATGVTPLILKVGATERKLAAVRDRVLRARDLLQELEPRLRTLKRSAARARSRAEVEASLRKAEETSAAHRWNALEETLRGVTEKRAAAEERVRTASMELERLQGPWDAALAGVDTLPKSRARVERLRAEERDLLLSLTRAEAADDLEVDRVAEEITARSKEREKLTNELGEVRATLVSARARRQTLAMELASVHGELATTQRKAPTTGVPPAIMDRLTEIRSQAERLAQKLRTAQPTTLPTLVADAERLENALKALEGQFRQSAAGSAKEESISAAIERLRLLANEQAKAGDTLAKLQAREAALTERLRFVEERIAFLKGRRQPGGDVTKPHGSIAEVRSSLVEVQRELSVVSQEVAKLEDALLRSHAERAHAQEEERRVGTLLHAAEQERSAIAAEEAAAKARRDDLVRDVTERLGAEFAERLLRGAVEVGQASTPETLRADIERLRKRLLDIGGFDAAVLQEEAVVEKRVTELRAQVADLEAAQKNLRTAIRELERHIHDRFATSFRAMNEAFNRTFREVFDGGRASLSLVKPQPVEHAFPDIAPEGEEGPREAPSGAEWGAPGDGHVHELPQGVEIHVHPPGKKLQGVVQLSGGEKALTSIALLFAILSERKSPFVVLDEVDAALDEANSRRFARLLKESARGTQFIVITHNRATMEAASALYGVTMGDDGVSQLLSIRLEQVPEAAERGHGTTTGR